MKQLVYILLSSCFMFYCKKQTDNNNSLPFASTPEAFAVNPGLVDEASGIADSYKNAGFLWTHEDSGNPTEIHLLKHDGSYSKKIFLKGTQNRDWEDMAVSISPNNVTEIYVADIGDNNSQYNSYSIYRFPEPAATVDTVFSSEKIIFQYPDGAHDTEAMLIDDATKDIYIITKRDSLSKVYKISYPQSLITTNTAVLVGTLSFSGAVSAAKSKDGKEIIIKSYSSLYYWKRLNNESIESALQKTPVTLSYKMEPQGEAICFKNDNTGFFTLSEKSFAQSVFLNFYKRL